MGRLPPAVRILVMANVAAFVATWLTQDKSSAGGSSGVMVEWFALWFPTNDRFGAWQFVTYMFMHGGLGHIFFNMFALASFGLVLEQLWGARRFLIFYFLCGVGAALVHVLVDWVEYQSLYAEALEARIPDTFIEQVLRIAPEYDGREVIRPGMPDVMVPLYWLHHSPMVGASGAVYGMLVAFGLLFPNAKLALLFIPVPVAAKYFIPVVLALDLLSGVTGFSLFGGGIAHFAHLGGALIGFLLMWIWRSRRPRPLVTADGGGVIDV